MTLIIGIAFGGLMAMFFTAFGMAIQRRIDGKDGEDAR